jgi:5'-3' exonuclease
VRLHLVDGTFELYRAHFSPRPGHTTPDGRDFKATVGVVAGLIGLLEEADEAVSHLAIAFDNPIRSFRNDLFDGYKDDEGVPPELRAQFDEVERAAAALGVKVWSMREWEADDALATAAARWGGKGVGEVDEVRILTPDKDLGQCLRPGVVLVDRIRRRVIDEAAVRERFGVGPESIPDYLALVGDDSDGIPGIAGFGAKAAAAVLARWGTLEAIPAQASAWGVAVRGAERLAASLREGRDDAILYKRLATLVRDVPLAETLEDLRYRGADRSAWQAWCDEVGAVELRERPRWR